MTRVTGFLSFFPPPLLAEIAPTFSLFATRFGPKSNLLRREKGLMGLFFFPSFFN